MSKEQDHIDDEIDVKPFRVRRGKVDSVDLYEVKESELEILENGAPVELFLNFSIFLFSTAISGTACLSTSSFTSKMVEEIFLLTTIVGYIGGIFLAILWYRSRRSITAITKVIRSRIPPTTQVSVRKSPKASENSEDDTQPEG